jgi:hypothetical protein
VLEGFRDRQARAGAEDFVFVDNEDRSQEDSNEPVWKPTLQAVTSAASIPSTTP